MSNKDAWNHQKEVKTTVLGIQFVLKVYSVFGRKITRACLYLIVVFYWLFAKRQRQYSLQYINTLKTYARHHNLILPKVNTFRHFLNYSETLLDKLLCWSGEISLSDLEFKHNDIENDSAQGLLILGSHLGNIEVCRALSELSKQRKVHILIQMEQTASFNAILQSLNAQSQVNLVPISDISPQTMMFLKEALDVGDIITILADRLPFNVYQRENNKLSEFFLGKKVGFPKGPFIMALLLQVPTFFLVAAKNQQKYDFYLHAMDVPKTTDRQMRQKNSEYLLKQYVDYLERYVIKYPMQWYNFYNFWQDADCLQKDAK